MLLNSTILIILALLFRHGFEPDSDSWEYVDTEANALPGDEVEYKVATMQNGLLVESKWTSGIYCIAITCNYHVIIVIDGDMAILTCLVFNKVYKQNSTMFTILDFACSLPVYMYIEPGHLSNFSVKSRRKRSSDV